MSRPETPIRHGVSMRTSPWFRFRFAAELILVRETEKNGFPAMAMRCRNGFANDLTRRPKSPKIPDIEFYERIPCTKRPPGRPAVSPGPPSTYAPAPQYSTLGEFALRLKTIVGISEKRFGELRWVVLPIRRAPSGPLGAPVITGKWALRNCSAGGIAYAMGVVALK